MNKQLSFWGFDEDGNSTNHGERLIYFVECGDFVKIGTTIRSVEDRISELACGNPAAMELIGTLVVRDGSDDRRLHQRFAMFHHKGEWFRKTPELMKSINDLLYSSKQPQNLRQWPTPLVVEVPEEDCIRQNGFDYMFFCPSCFGRENIGPKSGFGGFHFTPFCETENRRDFVFTCTECHTKVAVQVLRMSP